MVDTGDLFPPGLGKHPQKGSGEKVREINPQLFEGKLGEIL